MSNTVSSTESTSAVGVGQNLMTQVETSTEASNPTGAPFTSHWCHCGYEREKTQCIFIRGFWVYDDGVLGIKFLSLLKLPAEDHPTIHRQIIQAITHSIKGAKKGFDKLVSLGRDHREMMDDEGDELWPNSLCVRVFHPERIF
jgi:hypothetical protein